MALHAVMVQLQKIEILGCDVPDQSHISCTSKAMGGTRYVSASDVRFAEKTTGLPAELSDACSNVGSTENIDPKTPTRKKKNRSKAKLGRKFAKEVFPKDRGNFDAIQPYVWMKWARVKPVENNTLYSFVNGEWRDIPCLESNVHCRIRRDLDASQQPNSRKRIPVWKKKVKNPKSTISIDPRESNDDNSLSGNNGLHLQVSEVRINNFKVEAQKVQFIKDHLQPFHVPKHFQPLFINTQMVEHAFIASYRLQVASESVQQATGYPIAEFERLMWSAAPLIASSFSCQGHGGNFRNQPCSPSLYRERIPKISLQSIWKWYEEPGNYGLKVTMGDLQKERRFYADTVSFHAHFVPLLSAVQLFGFQNLSSSIQSQRSTVEINGEGTKSQPSLSDHPIFMSCLKASLMHKTAVDTVNPQAINHTSHVDIADGKVPPSAAHPASLGNADLIFEFFESEQPQRRAPLYNKIMELRSAGTPNNQVFGDPSRLECTNLDDLHPASWFSVAWYPIYRIPEGKLRAAFLTYHSLGYMVQKCTTNDSLDTKGGVVLPIIGLQSYNAQGELWFSPNSEAESSFRELTSTLVKERLGTLEENALGFARGMVCKDNVTVPNRQPDYEFFMSRKH